MGIKIQKRKLFACVCMCVKMQYGQSYPLDKCSFEFVDRNQIFLDMSVI